MAKCNKTTKAFRNVRTTTTAWLLFVVPFRIGISDPTRYELFLPDFLKLTLLPNGLVRGRTGAVAAEASAPEVGVAVKIAAEASPAWLLYSY